MKEAGGCMGWTWLQALAWGCLLAWLGAGLVACGPEKVTESRFKQLSEGKARRVVQGLDISSQGLKTWTDLTPAVERTLSALRAKNGTARILDAFGLHLTVQDLRTSLTRLQQVLPALEKDPGLLARHFVWFEFVPGTLVTGYYEPMLEGSFTKGPDYPYPLYPVPQDLQSVDLGRFHPRWRGERLIYRLQDGSIAPYHSRAQIDGEKVLQGTSQPIAWAKSLVEVFFLQIQGSGILRLPNGERQRIGYAGKNGRPYVSLGRVLVDRGYMTYAQLSMQSIKTFLHNHPELMPEILFTNPSYVFFRLTQGGPYGALGRELTPMVSLATDPGYLPLGALLALEVDLPGDKSGDTLSGLALAQDVGGAIKGRHVDLYCGAGKQAGRLAGRLKAEGRIFLVLAREVVEES